MMEDVLHHAWPGCPTIVPSMLSLELFLRDLYSVYRRHFERRNRSIAAIDVEKVYALFQGHLLYPKDFNESFADTPEGDERTLRRSGLPSILMGLLLNDTIFREILSNVPEKQKELLWRQCCEGEASVLHLLISSNAHSLPGQFGTVGRKETTRKGSYHRN